MNTPSGVQYPVSQAIRTWHQILARISSVTRRAVTPGADIAHGMDIPVVGQHPQSLSVRRHFDIRKGIITRDAITAVAEVLCRTVGVDIAIVHEQPVSLAIRCSGHRSGSIGITIAVSPLILQHTFRSDGRCCLHASCGRKYPEPIIDITAGRGPGA
jgi:hypothetical protein